MERFGARDYDEEKRRYERKEDLNYERDIICEKERKFGDNPKEKRHR